MDKGQEEMRGEMSEESNMAVEHAAAVAARSRKMQRKSLEMQR